MIRLMGGIVGSALAIALLLLLVGIPQFRVPAEEPEPSVMTLPLRTTPVDAPSRPGETPPDDAPPAVDEDPGAAADAGPPETPGDNLAAAAADAETAGAGANEWPAADRNGGSIAGPALPVATGEPAGATAASEPQWYTFWSPFRSEVAASGFVARLQSVTGLDYRIVRRETGVYEVAFAYRNDDEIMNNLSHITAATGLDLAGR